jgi:hypothetical protein
VIEWLCVVAGTGIVFVRAVVRTLADSRTCSSTAEYPGTKGVTIDDAFRVEVGKRVWIAELESI